MIRTWHSRKTWTERVVDRGEPVRERLRPQVTPGLLLLAAMACAACGVGAMPISQSPRDPSNPLAAEGAAPPASAPLPSASAAGVYACPMHPEVRAASPGPCPKCGMLLVRRPE